MTGTVEAELESFTRGDVQAFEALFRQYQGEVYGWIVRIVRDTGVAEDLTIETFWRIYRARARFDPHRPFGAWTRRIATNLALEHLSRRHAEMPLDDGLPIRVAAAPAPDPAIGADVRAKVVAAFGELPAKLRAAATLAVIEETPYAEIADALGISINGVKSRVFRAFRLLRRSLAKRGVCP
ncbi:MAG TPA: RNA polymerase sigma factor [Phycisphaerae bacterium]|nr:RNA polymerase sigma factor [Phycisphaerae bacterium]